MAKQRSAWLKHVMRIKGENAGMSFKDVLKLAKKSYSKVTQTVDDKVVKPVTAKIKAKKSRKSRRSSKKSRRSSKKSRRSSRRRKY